MFYEVSQCKLKWVRVMTNGNLHMQEPALHLSLGVDSSQHSHGVTAQGTAPPAESQEALHEASLESDRNSGPVTGLGGEGEQATIGEQDNDPAGAFPTLIYKVTEQSKTYSCTICAKNLV